MDEAQIRTRLDYLFYALQFSSQKRETLTVGERIVINQECAQLLRLLENPYTEVKLMPESIEIKLKESEHFQHVYGWTPFERVRFEEKTIIN